MWTSTGYSWMWPCTARASWGRSHVENVAELACRTAMTYSGVAHITFPMDIQDMKASRRSASKRNVQGHTSDVHAESGHVPNESDLRRAAEILNNGKKIAILAGQGALHATDALEQTGRKAGRADRQGAAGQSRGAG